MVIKGHCSFCLERRTIMNFRAINALLRSVLSVHNHSMLQAFTFLDRLLNSYMNVPEYNMKGFDRV